MLPDGRHFLFYATGTAPGIYVGQLDSSETRRHPRSDAAAYGTPGICYSRVGSAYSPRHSMRYVSELSGQPITVTPKGRGPERPGTGFAFGVCGGPIVYRAGRLGGRAAAHLVRPNGKALEAVPGSYPIREISCRCNEWRHGGSSGIGEVPTVGILTSHGGCPRDSRLTRLELYQSGSPAASAWLSVDPEEREWNHVRYLREIRETYRITRSCLLEGRGPNPSDWSLGRFVSLYRTTPGHRAVRPDGDRKPFPVVETNLGANNGQFSPDGKWIAYQSGESGGRAEIFVQRFPGPGGKSQVSSVAAFKCVGGATAGSCFTSRPTTGSWPCPSSSTQGVTPWRLALLFHFSWRASAAIPKAGATGTTWSRQTVSVF